MASEEPPRRPPRISVELLLGASATFLSVCALVVSLVQTKIARQQQHAAVWPFLTVGTGRVDEKLTLQVENKGVGPALIRGFEVRYQGRSYPSHVPLLQEQLPRDFPGSRFFVVLRPGDVVKPGEEVRLFEIDRDARAADRLDALLGGPDITLRFTYADIYGNCWVASLQKVEPTPCPGQR